MPYPYTNNIMYATRHTVYDIFYMGSANLQILFCSKHTHRSTAWRRVCIGMWRRHFLIELVNQICYKIYVYKMALLSFA